VPFQVSYLSTEATRRTDCSRMQNKKVDGARLGSQTELRDTLSGAFAKPRKATTRFVTACPSDVFSRNFVLRIFTKICRHIQRFRLKLDKNNNTYFTLIPTYIHDFSPCLASITVLQEVRVEAEDRADYQVPNKLDSKSRVSTFRRYRL
jgi:hypothetical protein